MSISIRDATAADAQRVIDLYDEFNRYLSELGVGDGEDCNFTQELYRRDGFGPNPAFFGLIAESDGDVVGYLLYHFGYDTELADRVMYILDLYVTQAQRMRGAGASLMARAKSICHDADATEILWSVYKPNQAARKFYQRLGAEIIDDLDYMFLKVER
jgi:ribosomal protein S18 acetylase RimI-like enzyme